MEPPPDGRRRYGWISGWVAICAYAAANTTIAYLGAPWALTLAGHRADAERDRGRRHACSSSLCAVAGALGIDVLGAVVKVGIAAEIVASVGIGLALLLVFRTQDVSILTHTLGAEALSGGSVGAGLLAALAVGGWVFIGFDACVGAAEETQGRRPPRPARDLDRAAQRRRARDPQRVRRRRSRTPTRPRSSPARDVDPVTTAVVASFGSWSAKPFAAVVLIAFLACGMAAQALTARTIYSIARDGVLPALRLPAPRRPPAGRRSARSSRPRSIACLGLLLGLRLGRGRQPDRVRHGRDLRRRSCWSRSRR